MASAAAWTPVRCSAQPEIAIANAIAPTATNIVRILASCSWAGHVVTPKAERRAPRDRRSAPQELVHEPLRIVDLRQGLENSCAVHAHGAAASGLVNVEIAVGQLLLVAVEIDADQFAVAVDERASRITADRVDGIDEVERRGQIQPIAARRPPLAEIVGWLLAESLRPIEQPVERRLPRDQGRVFLVTKGPAEPESERKRRVRI